MNILTLEKKIPSDCQDLRFDVALARMFPEYSRAQLSKWIKLKQITIDGKTPKTTYKVKGFEVVNLACKIIAQTTVKPQDIQLDVKYEDDDLMVINKPANLVVHPGAGNPDNTLVNALLFYNNTLENLPRAGIVHRLDKDTTGLMIVAKTIESFNALTKLMQDRKIERYYQAIVYGNVEYKQTIDTCIGRHPTARTRMAVVNSGKHAVTHINILQNYKHITHLDIKLETGRTHQIRVHLTHIAHPLIGDQTYKNKNSQKMTETKLKYCFDLFKRQALHAYKLEFSHPISHKKISLIEDLPDDLLTLLEKIKELSANET